MADITTTGSGNWSSTTADAPWPSGTVPTSSDDVTIDTGHTVTIDTTGCACKYLEIDGKINVSTSSSSDLTLGYDATNTTDILVNDGGEIDADVSSAASITFTLILNKGGNTTGTQLRSNYDSTVTLKGADKNSWTRLSAELAVGATSATVSDATGWRVGDTIVFGTTQAYADPPAIDEVVLTSVSGNTIGWSGGVTYKHLINGYVGNFTRNLVVKGYGTNSCGISLYNSYRYVSNVEFYKLNRGPSYAYGLSFNAGKSGEAGHINNNAFYKCLFYDVYIRVTRGIIERTRNVFYSESPYHTINGQTAVEYSGYWKECIIFSAKGSGLHCIHSGEKFVDCVAMDVKDTDSAMRVGAFKAEWKGCSIIASNYAIRGELAGEALLTDCLIGTEFGATNNTVLYFSNQLFAKLVNCDVQTTGTIISGLVDSTKSLEYGANFINKNNDVSSQELYHPHLELFRENTTYHRSTSSISIEPTILDTDCQKEQDILCANGSTINVIGYVQVDSTFYNSGTWEAPTVTLSGLDETDVVFTASSSANGAWEKYDIAITNNSGNDGNFTLTFNANASDVLGGIVYFDGVPDAPFITKCRHYGYVIDESNPVRKVDSLIDTTEATAIAYTGVTISNTNQEISFSSGTADDYQKFYDFVMATMCANLDYEIPFTRAGALFSLDADWTVIEPEYACTWDGGTIEWDTVGTKSGGFSDNKFDFSTAGDYNFGTSTFSGSVELINTSGGNVTVSLPSGTTYVNTGPNITVTVVANTFKFTVNPAIVDYEWRIYEVDEAGSLTGSVEKAGEESATSSSQSYDFDTAATIALQILAQPDNNYVENVTYYELDGADVTVTINLKPEVNL